MQPKPKTMDAQKVDAEIAKLMAETMRLNAESLKIQAETAKINREWRWYPVMLAAGFVTALAALLKSFL